ncbi:MAG: hypothetical protein K5755_02535 [Clostridiales bacterium]|nr:hypothetical protein [Clostridiales bacterium]
MKNKILLLLTAVILAALFLMPVTAFAEEGDGVTEPETEQTTEPETEPYVPYELTLKKTGINIGLGESLSAYSLITNADKKEKAFNFTSSDDSILLVDFDGRFKGIGIGQADLIISEWLETETVDETTGETVKEIKENELGRVAVNVRKEPDSIKLNATCLALGIGEKYDLNVATKNGSAYGRTFTSSDKTVATVSLGGIITPKKTGTVKIKASIYDGKTVTCTVTVTKKPVTFKITNSNTKVQKGSTNHKMTYKVSDSTLKVKPVYSVGSTKIAKISTSGKVTGVKTGKTAVKIKTQYDNLYASQTITVVDNALYLNKNSAQLALDCSNVTRVKYGESYQGRMLEAYVITNKKTGTYEKTLFMDFAVHGFEDSYAKDGKVLVKEANRIIDYYSSHSEELKNYRLVIIPCANPDGTIAGKNNLRAEKKAFGRCTANHIDMNRDFKSFKAVESKALKKYIAKCEPDIYLNMHGWYDETLGTKKLNGIIMNAQEFSTRKDGKYGSSYGYIIGFVRDTYKIPCALVEYKSPDEVYLDRDVKMINNIIKSYK